MSSLDLARIPSDSSSACEPDAASAYLLLSKLWFHLLDCETSIVRKAWDRFGSSDIVSRLVNHPNISIGEGTFCTIFRRSRARLALELKKAGYIQFTTGGVSHGWKRSATQGNRRSISTISRETTLEHRMFPRGWLLQMKRTHFETHRGSLPHYPLAGTMHGKRRKTPGIQGHHRYFPNRHPAPELSASKPEDQYADRWSAVVRLGRNVNHQQSAEAARSWLLFGCPLTSW